MLRFSSAHDSFQNGAAKHGCVGAHGVSLLFLAAVLGCCSWLLILGCCSSLLQSFKTTLFVSPRRTTCISVGATSMLPFVSVSFSNSFKTMIYSFGPSYARTSAQVFKLFLLVLKVYVLCPLLLHRVCCIIA